MDPFFLYTNSGDLIGRTVDTARIADCNRGGSLRPSQAISPRTHVVQLARHLSTFGRMHDLNLTFEANGREVPHRTSESGMRVVIHRAT